MPAMNDPIPFPQKSADSQRQIELGGILSVREKLTPQSLESEQSTLGSCLMGDAEPIAIMLSMLVEADFYRELHKKIFRAIATLFSKGLPVDIVSVAEALRTKGQLDDVGGSEYLSALIDACPSSANIEFYAGKVLEMSERRRYLAAAERIKQMAYGGVEDLDDLKAGAEQLVMSTRGDVNGQECRSSKTLAISTLRQLELQMRGGGKISGTPTGFHDLDRITSGLKDQDLIVIGARPGMGKSAFAMQIAVQVAKTGKLVLIFSLEMPAEQLMQRMICNEARVDFNAFRNGKISRDEMLAVMRATYRIEQLPLWIQDTSDSTTFDIASRARRIEAAYGPIGLIVVDYLQLIPDQKGNSNANKADAVGANCKALRIVARQRKCPLIALSQLSRKVEDREDKRPINSDLRDSGSIEAEANEIYFLYNDGYYKRREAPSDDPRICDNDKSQMGATDDITEIIIGKQRNGARGMVKLYWTGHHVRFDNLTTAKPPEEDGYSQEEPPLAPVYNPTHNFEDRIEAQRRQREAV